MMQPAAENTAKTRSHRKSRVGVVIADAKQKTVRVRLDLLVKHSKYGKYMKTQKNIHVHDELNVCKAGDVVEITECRPISKTKSWRVARKIRESAAS